MVVQALMTAAVVEWRAKLYTPARRLFEAAIREAAHCGVLAMQFVAWTWADCELQQGRAAMATEVLNRALHSCKTPALILLLAKVPPRPIHSPHSKCLNLQEYFHVQWLEFQHIDVHALVQK